MDVGRNCASYLCLKEIEGNGVQQSVRNQGNRRTIEFTRRGITCRLGLHHLSRVVYVVMELKMNRTIVTGGKLLIILLIFVFLFGATSHFVPYLITHERYTELSGVRETFPIAILDHGTPDIVCWAVYQNNVDLYKDKIILVPTQKKYKFREDGFFRLRSAPNNILKLFIHERDRNYWAKYSVSNGIIKPISYRVESPSVVFVAAPVALIGTPLIVCIYKLIVWAHKRHKRSRST